jgi:hypothetical protein
MVNKSNQNGVDVPFESETTPRAALDPRRNFIRQLAVGSIAGGALLEISAREAFARTSAAADGVADGSSAMRDAVNTVTHQMENGAFSSFSYTSLATSENQIISSLSIASIRSAKYFVQLTSESAHQVREILVVHDGITPSWTEYGDIATGAILATFSFTIAGGNLNLVFTPVNAITAVKATITSINI